MLNQQMQQNVAFLRNRYLHNFKRSHWLQTGPQLLVCLDFNLVATSKEEMTERLLSAMGAAAPDVPLPASGVSLWEQFCNAPNKEQFPIHTDLSPRGGIHVMIRGR